MTDQVPTEFDQFASEYKVLHAESISISGEDPEYFARYKVNFLKSILPQKFQEPILDYGCGVGSVTRYLADEFPAVEGFDVSLESLKIAREKMPTLKFYSDLSSIPSQYYGVVFLSGVLHHVMPQDRLEVVNSVLEKLKPGGFIFIFEHNPWNPLTRYAVCRCPFDKDAKLLPYREGKKILSQSALECIENKFIVFFPKFLAFLRPLESKLFWLPIGAQYVLSARKPLKR